MDILNTETVLMLVRILVGLLVVPHGIKLAMSPKQPPLVVILLGWKPLALWAALVWGSLLGGGLLMILGLAAPLGNAMVVATMVVAVASKRGRGYWSAINGVEYPMTLGLLAALMGLTGPGRYSLDAALGLHSALPALGSWLALAALATVLGGVVAGVLVYRLPVSTPAEQTAQSPTRRESP